MDRTHQQTIVALRILNDRANAPPRCVHKLAILDGAENYDGLRDGLRALREELAGLAANGLTVADKHYKVVFFWASDLKFTHLARGFKSCRADKFCAWCNATRADRLDLQKVWCVDETRLDETKREDLFPFVPLRRIVPDGLHCLLRHYDLLFELFIGELWQTASSLGLSTTATDSRCIELLEAEFKRIGVSFKTWPRKETR